MTDDPTELTPVEEIGDGLFLKRDDLFEINNARGGKLRSCLAFCENRNPKGLVSGGSRHSPQLRLVSVVAQRLGIPARLFTAKAKLMSLEVIAASTKTTKVVLVPAGYSNVVTSRAQNDAAERGWLMVPFGMICSEAVQSTASQVKNIPKNIRTIVLPAGSGMTAAGVSCGLKKRGLSNIKMVAIGIGSPPLDRIRQYGCDWGGELEFIQNEHKYDDALEVVTPNGVRLDEIYEAKAWPYILGKKIKRPALFWIVGCRTKHGEAPITKMPNYEIFEKPERKTVDLFAEFQQRVAPRPHVPKRLNY